MWELRFEQMSALIRDTNEVQGDKWTVLSMLASSPLLIAVDGTDSTTLWLKEFLAPSPEIKFMDMSS